MIPFYYKGLLFSEANSARDYSRDIYLLAEWSSEIQNEKYIKMLKNENISFCVSTSTRISSRITLIYEINEHGDLFGIYNKETQKFMCLRPEILRNIPYRNVKTIEKKINRLCAAIYRGELNREHSSLIYPTKHMWTIYKGYIEKQSKIDVINTIKEAELIMSKDRHIETHDQLRQIFRKDEEFER